MNNMAIGTAILLYNTPISLELYHIIRQDVNAKRNPPSTANHFSLLAMNAVASAIATSVSAVSAQLFA